MEMKMSDLVAQYIVRMLDETGGNAEIQRNELASILGCVPSQINYVITSRFTPEQGYIVESRRGGGGQITITRVSHAGPEHYLQAIVDAVGDDLSQQQARTLLTNAVSVGAITPKEGTAIMAAVSDRALAKVDSDIRAVLRADIFRNALLGLMIAE